LVPLPRNSRTATRTGRGILLSGGINDPLCTQVTGNSPLSEGFACWMRTALLSTRSGENKSRSYYFDVAPYGHAGQLGDFQMMICVPEMWHRSLGTIR
jgi:hypothetical protein